MPRFNIEESVLRTLAYLRSNEWLLSARR
jgi:hypothetical protein